MTFDEIDPSNGNDAANFNPVCKSMLNFQLTGNVTPISWYGHILTNSGKPDVVAITILSDIMYWYKPTLVRDEISGDLIEIKQKFKFHQLQKTYQEYSDLFGFSKKRVKEAFDNLESKKLVIRDFKDIRTKTGLRLINVMFVEPVLENIDKISNKIRTPLKSGGPPPQKGRDLPSKKQGTSSEKNTPHHTKKNRVVPQENGYTNTENTPSENTTTTTTPEVDVVSSETRIPEKLTDLIPEIYRGHKGVLKNLPNFINSRGIDYVEKELRYAAENSSKEGGFPAFLMRALENGWAAETAQVQLAIDEKKQREFDRQSQKRRIERKKSRNTRHKSPKSNRIWKTG